MEKRELTAQMIRDFAAHLARRERAPATVAKYLHGVRSFAAWLGKDGLSPEKVSAWKAGLREALSPATVNGRIAAVNALFQFLRWDDCRTGALKVQRRAFRADERELGRGDYRRLVETVEVPANDFFVGVQFHPEFKSRPNKPHPLFLGLVGAAKKKKQNNNA